MDSQSLFYSLELVAGSGNILSVEQRAALQTSLVILKRDHKFQRVLFWGKILGLRGDYYIAQGRGEDELTEKKNLYSFNCIDWFLLPPATPALMEEVLRTVKGRHTGDPSHVYEIKVGEAEETKVTEEKRLAVTVHLIDSEVAVVPRGAFIKSPHGYVQVNRSFGGLSHTEARKLDSFLHFCPPNNMMKKSILEMGELNPAIDFLDPLSDDIPKGSWSLHFENAKKVCVLRSLLWLGLTSFHVPMTSQHGYIYIGDGLKNLSLPVML